MPTPDETACPPSPPSDISARSSYPSCPPEEEREACDDEGEETEETGAEAEGDGHAIVQEPTPEPDAIEGASTDRESQLKVENTATSLNTPSPVASPDAVAPDGDMPAQASLSNPNAPIPFPSQYLDFAPNKQRVCIDRYSPMDYF